MFHVQKHFQIQASHKTVDCFHIRADILGCMNLKLSLFVCSEKKRLQRQTQGRFKRQAWQEKPPAVSAQQQQPGGLWQVHNFKVVAEEGHSAHTCYSTSLLGGSLLHETWKNSASMRLSTLLASLALSLCLIFICLAEGRG